MSDTKAQLELDQRHRICQTYYAEIKVKEQALAQVIALHADLLAQENPAGAAPFGYREAELVSHRIEIQRLIAGHYSAVATALQLHASSLEVLKTMTKDFVNSGGVIEDPAQSQPRIARGTYVCLEGADGTGKTTLTQALCTELRARGRDVALRAFPSDNEVGSLIRAGLRGEKKLSPKAYMYLFCADAWQASREIELLLANGINVVGDRHPTFSGRVFQVDHHAEQVVKTTYENIWDEGVTYPDLLFVLDAAPELSLIRMQQRPKYKDVVFESDDIDRIKELRWRYAKLSETYGAEVLNAELPTAMLVDIIIEKAGL